MPVSSIVNRLKPLREHAGLSQRALARQVGVSRQALVAIEAGRQVPSTTLALELARALHCRVDDLFQLVASGALEAVLAPMSGALRRRVTRLGGDRVAMGHVGGRWVAHRLADDDTAADGVITPGLANASATIVEPLADPADLEHNVLVAGCAPLLGVLAQRAGRRYRDVRVTRLAANSRRALDLLDAGLVHVAGLHFVDGRSSDGNLPVLRKRFAGRRMLVINLTRWRQGLLVPRGNPLAVREAGDLLRDDLRFVRRERGSGANQLALRVLAALGAKGTAVPPGPLAGGHLEVAHLVRGGAADVGIAIESAALAHDLDFIPLSEERFDLVVPLELAREAPVARIIDLLGDPSYRAETARLPGYDGSCTGETIELDAA